MATETKHTPGPIRVEDDCKLVASDGYSLTAGGGLVGDDWGRRAKANAAHAALCWNSHDQLIEACKKMIEWDDAEHVAKPFSDDNGVGFYGRMELCDQSFKMARAALAAAEEAGQ